MRLTGSTAKRHISLGLDLLCERRSGAYKRSQGHLCYRKRSEIGANLESAAILGQMLLSDMTNRMEFRLRDQGKQKMLNLAHRVDVRS